MYDPDAHTADERRDQAIKEAYPHNDANIRQLLEVLSQPNNVLPFVVSSDVGRLGVQQSVSAGGW